MFLTTLRVGAGLLIACFLASPLAAHEPQEAEHRPASAGAVALTAGDAAAAATFSFRVVDGDRPETLIPARLTFVGEDGQVAKVFTDFQASPDELALRAGVLYSLRGAATITVSPGSYTVYASRGMEWSLARRELTFQPGQAVREEFSLRHEVDTRGWISGDFHLHTLTHSGHGDANLKERCITFVGEGMEFAVATDHNHNTDYGPTLAELGMTGTITAVTGNEVTTPIGHFNAFPLDPSRPIPPPQAQDAVALFKLIREEPNAFGIVPVIQINHPRWGGIDYFTQLELDPLTGTSTNKRYSELFDTIEVFNANEGWGYFDAEYGGVDEGASRHWVLRDWFNLLNRGRVFGAVGNSDSHYVHAEVAGWPRNFMPSPTDDPGRIQAADVAACLRARQSFTTLGPFVEWNLNGRSIVGAQLLHAERPVTTQVRVQAASWIDCDRVKVIVNGDVTRVIPVPDVRTPLRLDVPLELSLTEDSWVALLVEGDDPLHPIVHTRDRPVLPLAVVNPIWIDADGDGRWVSPWEQVQQLVRSAEFSAPSAAQLAGLPPHRRGLLALAAAEHKHASAAALIQHGLADSERSVRLLALRAAETLADASLTADVQRAYAAAESDPYARVAALRALGASDRSGSRARAFAFIDQHGPETAKRYADELLDLLPGNDLRDWQITGYFPASGTDSLRTVFGPETAAAADAVFKGRDGDVRWQTTRARSSGYLDLRSLAASGASADKAIAYAQTFVHVASEREAHYALGTDDGCRLWVNGALAYEDLNTHAANRFQQLGKLALKPGWNRVVVAVYNAGGAYGLYFRVFESDVQVSATPQP